MIMWCTWQYYLEQKTEITYETDSEISSIKTVNFFESNGSFICGLIIAIKEASRCFLVLLFLGAINIRLTKTKVLENSTLPNFMKKFKPYFHQVGVDSKYFTEEELNLNTKD